MSNRARTQFECDGVAFDVGRLNLNDSCNGLELLAKVLGPAISQLQENPAAALTALLGQASHIPKLLGLFAPVAKFWRDPNGTPCTEATSSGGAFVDLKPFADAVFTSRLELACAFIAECVKLEYSTFLASATSGALAQQLAKV